MSDPFAPEHLLGHVKDAEHFELPEFLWGGKVTLPQPFAGDRTLVQSKLGTGPISSRIEPIDLRLTKFMVLEVVAAVIIAVLFIRVANRISKGGPPRGRLWNMLEGLLIYIRDQIARPAIGKHDADQFLPFLWTMFFFVLVCNLLGLVPWAGSATGALATTGTLALITFATVIGAGMAKLGPVGFWIGQVPHMDLPAPLAFVLKPMMFVLEVTGLFIKHFVLAMRLLANMMAGHLVLAVVISFIAASAGSMAIWAVAPASILGATALCLLELLVAFIQAYVFTFLSALFIGMAVHPH